MDAWIYGESPVSRAAHTEPVYIPCVSRVTNFLYHLRKHPAASARGESIATSPIANRRDSVVVSPKDAQSGGPAGFRPPAAHYLPRLKACYPFVVSKLVPASVGVEESAPFWWA